METDDLPTTPYRYIGLTEDEALGLLAWLPKYDDPVNTWERNLAAVRRKLEALGIGS